MLPPPVAPGRQAEPSPLCEALGRDRDADYRQAGSNCHSAILLRSVRGPTSPLVESKAGLPYIDSDTPSISSFFSWVGCKTHFAEAEGLVILSRSVSQFSSIPSSRMNGRCLLPGTRP